MYLISIYFDRKTEKRLQDFIHHVAKATGNFFMIDNQVPPHITIAAVETRQEKVLLARIEELVESLETASVDLVSIGTFSSQVIYIQPVLNEYLHQLSVVFSQELGKMDETICRSYYQPFHWLPHCTIAKQLSREQMVQAFKELQNHFMPMTGQVVRLGVAKTNPHRDIKSWEL